MGNTVHENNDIIIQFEKLVSEVQERVNEMKGTKISAVELKCKGLCAYCVKAIYVYTHPTM